MGFHIPSRHWLVQEWHNVNRTTCPDHALRPKLRIACCVITAAVTAGICLTKVTQSTLIFDWAGGLRNILNCDVANPRASCARISGFWLKRIIGRQVGVTISAFRRSDLLRANCHLQWLNYLTQHMYTSCMIFCTVDRSGLIPERPECDPKTGLLLVPDGLRHPGAQQSLTVHQNTILGFCVLFQFTVNTLVIYVAPS